MQKKNNIFIKCIMVAGVITVITAMIIVFGKFGKTVTAAKADNAGITATNTVNAENTGNADEIKNSSKTNRDKTDNKDIYIPDSLLELKEKYPETADFVNSYPDYEGTQLDMDISDEIV